MRLPNFDLLADEFRTGQTEVLNVLLAIQFELEALNAHFGVAQDEEVTP